MKTVDIVKHIIKEEPVKVKESITSVLKQKIAKHFKESIKG